MRVGPYKVTFTHSQDLEYANGTSCFIWEQSGIELRVLAEGCAWLHPNDNYCKNIGRKIALARALEKFGAHKELRAQFWKAYYEMRGNKW